jgi:hypothetical protein
VFFAREASARRKLSSTFAAVAVAVVAFCAAATGAARADPAAITPKAQHIIEQLDQMGVESKWIAGAHIDWRTGLPDGRPITWEGRHTHCSAFVASAAEKLGVHILRPPEHGQELLANAQNEWLASSDARREGWRPVEGWVEAQTLANQGSLVVASYHNHHDDKPGHIAIVLPGDKSKSALEAEGPNVIEAGTVNSASISLKAGFAGHPHAWVDQEIDLYAHAVP